MQIQIPKKVQTYLAVLTVFFLVAAASYAYNHTGKDNTKTTTQKAGTAEGVKAAASEQRVAISDHQAVEASEETRRKIEAINAGIDKPDETVTTTGANQEHTLALIKEEHHGDIQLVTNAKDPNKPPEKPAPNQTVINNVIDIQAYPSAIITVGVGPDSAQLAYQHRVKIFKWTGYLGPAVIITKDADGRMRPHEQLLLTVPIK